MSRPLARRSPLAGDAVALDAQGEIRTGASPASGLLRALVVVMVMMAMLAFVGVARAQAIEPMPFANHAQELRFQHLVRELRCPMCQDETLEDSNAPIARDLRNQVFRLMQQGKSDKEIKQFLVARYSDYILYNPPLKPGTWLLWFGPLLILIGGAGVVLVAIRKRKRHGIEATTVGDSADDGEDW